MLRTTDISTRPVLERNWRQHVLSVRKEKQIHIVVCLVATVFEISHDQLYAPSRCVRRTAFARQIAMYISHIWLGLTLTEIGKHFGRDRTTVAYACQLMEDRRDNPIVNNMLDVMETAVSSWHEFCVEQAGIRS